MLGLLRGERVLTHNLIVGAGTMTAGVLGVAFQSIASHQLRPADYGAVFAVVTLITFIGLPASAFTLLMARETSHGRAAGHQASSAALLRGGNRSLVLLGLAIGIALALGSPLLSRFFEIPASLLLAAAAGMPFGLALPLLLGELQGEERFTGFAVLSTGQAGLKLLAAIGLGLIFGPLGVIAGISVATFVVYVIALRMVRRKLLISPNLAWWKPAAAYLAVVLPSTLALAVLLSSDVLLVKHFFPTRAAGDYAAVAALGRAIFWGASGVAVVLFPKVTFRGAQGRSGLVLVAASLLLVGLGGLVGLVVLSFASRWLLTAFAGSAYAAGANYLSWYALGMVLLGAAAVLIATHQSQGEPRFLAILLPLAMLEPGLIVAFHQNLIQVVQVVDISMFLVAIGLAAWYLVQERATRLAVLAAVSAGVQGGPQLQVTQ
jgi:O-antigen/teichoic acid export membrane protein